jgi:acetolactate synthase I/II/III large subunit
MLERMTGGDAIAAALRAHGIDTIFGVPGAQVYGLFDAFLRSGLRVVGARHEQTAAYMALGYARSTGRPAVYAVVPGPGMLNTGAALITALGCNAPVLCITGEVPSDFIGKERGHLHEMPDQLATMRQLTKWAGRMESPADAPAIVARAFQEMMSGRRGPAAIEMPWDVFTAVQSVRASQPLPAMQTPPVDPDAVAKIVALIATARAPMIMVGGGASDAGPEVAELAERLVAPVVAFRSGRGVVDDRNDLSLTLAGAHELYAKADLLIGIGTRLEVPQLRFKFQPEGLKTIRIDIDPAEMRRYRPTLGLVADAAEGVRALLVELNKIGVKPDQSRRQPIVKAKHAAAQALAALSPQMDYLAAIRAALPEDGILVDEMCQVGYAAWVGYPTYAPRTLITSGYQGTLGYGFPTALGVQVAHPDRAVVSIAGDGGFMFAMPELATAIQYKIPLTTVVFNNASYGNVRRDQQVNFDGRIVAADLVNPDFLKLGESFGVWTRRVQSANDLLPVLREAIALDEPAMIEVVVPRGSEPSPWKFISPPPP